MRTPPALLRFVAQAALNHLDFTGSPDSVLEVLPDVARDAWNGWNVGRDPQQMREELERLTGLPADELRLAAEAVADDVAAGRPAELRRGLASFLVQLPASVRQSMRRPGDPSGRSAPPNLLFKEADDLLPFLPTRLPRFQPGSRPLPGVDWELTELLGVGGFGEVWKAKHIHFDGIAPVALKFCLDEAAKERLLKHEASVLNQVMRQGRHPGIIELRHTYLSADPPCLEYEYVEGGDLSGLIQAWNRAPAAPARSGQTHPLVAQATKVLRELAEVVAFAHGLNPSIVHRDLKPANILLQRTKDGKLTPRVADFGIGGVAARQAIARTERSRTGGAFLTTALRGSHTPLYASPEQMKGKDPDPRDDVHALGVIWYQMLTGDLSRGRPSGRSWRKQLAEKGMKAELLDLLETCVSDDLDERPRHAGILVGELDALLKTAAPPPIPDLPPPVTVLPAAVAPPPDDRAARDRGRDFTGPKIVVDQGGGGQFRRLIDAVQAARPGTRILVRPGVYMENSIVLDKQLEIIGEGPVENIILRCPVGSTLVTKTQQAYVRGLTLRGGTDKAPGSSYIVDIAEGQLELANCRISGTTLSGVAIHTAAAHALLTGCKIHDIQSGGIYVFDRGRGVLEGCTITGSKNTGVSVWGESELTLRECHIHANTVDGLSVWDKAQAILERCEVYANANTGVTSTNEAHLTMRNCNVHDGKGSGVSVFNKGRATIEECLLVANTTNGIAVMGGGHATLRRCRLNRNNAWGVYSDPQGCGVVENCDLTGNRHGPWNLPAGSDFRRSGNKE